MLLCLERWSIVVTYAAFGAIAVYAFLTYRMFKQTVKQTNLLVRPFLAIEPSHRAGQYRVRNVGNGTAIGVKLENVIVVIESGGRLEFEFKQIDLIPTREDRDLGCEVLLNGKPVAYEDFPFATYVSPLNRKETFDLKLDFQDIQQNKYHSVWRIGKGAITLVSQGEG